jgi:hypothetical protein
MLENNGRFSANTELYPSKIPNNSMGCPIRVTTIGYPPFVILAGNYTGKDGETRYNVRGYVVEDFLPSAEKMNLTVNLLRPNFGRFPDTYLDEVKKVYKGLVDIAIGVVPVISFVPVSHTLYAVTYTTVEFRICVPCPTRVHRMESIMSMFTLPVWLSLILVLILAGAVFWCSENITQRPLHTTTSLSLSLYNAWAILMLVSVSKFPETWKQRTFFLLYVFYCFVVVTVFQAFFFSYLVEPSYQKQIRTFDDLVESDLLYGMDFADIFWPTKHLEYLEKLPDARVVYCDNTEQCMKRMLSRRDIAMACDPDFAKYISSSAHGEQEGKAVCYIEDSQFYISSVAFALKGNPLIERLYTLIRRCVEGGLKGRCWSDTYIWNHFHPKEEVPEDSSDTYFVLTTSHLSAAFGILILGLFFSFVVFLCEIIFKMCRRKLIK